LLLLDYKDLRAILNEVGNRAKELQQTYGNISTASIGTIQRQLLVLEGQGGEKFFGEPALDLKDFMRTEYSGRGFINILAANKLMNSPKLYATFLLWMLAELFEELPEVGDPEKPKLVFFFDEAHLLFSDAPKALLEKVEQVVRLIRSKGVGVYFITQNPADIPDTVLAQLGNRVQHALRAFTPTEQKAIRAASNSFRPNPNFNTEEAITQLGVGWGLVSMLDEKGSPCIVERTAVRPPFSRLGPATPEELQTVRNGSPVSGKYDQAVDRESAFEVLRVKTEAAMKAHEEEEARIAAEKQAKQEAKAKPAARRGDSLVDAALKSALRSVGSTVGRQIVRGILGNMFKR
jgi:DNA helicase HerA-like ATPase